MTERDDIRSEPNDPTGNDALDERAALAARVDDDPTADAGLDERSRRTVARMRELGAALREAGPARVSDGFADRVLARLEQPEAPVVRLAQRARARRTSLTIIVQAASLVALLFTYGALLAATRVHDVGPRWSDADDSDEPATGARLETAPATLHASASTVAASTVVLLAINVDCRVARAASSAARKPSIPLLPTRGASV